MEIDENEFLKSATTLPDCKEKFAPPPKLIEVMQASKEEELPGFQTITAGLEALASGVALAAYIRAKDLAATRSGYHGDKEKIDEAVLKRFEDALVGLQKALG